MWEIYQSQSEKSTKLVKIDESEICNSRRGGFSMIVPPTQGNTPRRLTSECTGWDRGCKKIPRAVAAMLLGLFALDVEMVRRSAGGQPNDLRDERWIAEHQHVADQHSSVAPFLDGPAQVLVCCRRGR